MYFEPADFMDQTSNTAGSAGHSLTSNVKMDEHSKPSNPATRSVQSINIVSHSPRPAPIIVQPKKSLNDTAQTPNSPRATVPTSATAALSRISTALAATSPPTLGPSTPYPRTPTMPNQPDVALLANISTEALNSLRRTRDLLHLLAHRNKNQHRRSTWWRHLSHFRSELRLLVGELEALSANLGDAKTREMVAARVGRWRDALVPRWYFAFSQLTAGTQFAAIGVALLAMLASVARQTGITAAYAVMPVEGEVEVVRRGLLSAAGEDRAGGLEGVVGEYGVLGVEEEDVGLVVGRET
ncbi:RNase MRP subunit [Coniosporium tulheliwenetii]|uniref:RNase MRP subunit n=1 Tax=Coniosporium tulheliwenetii TaxID=3383036 RepID=A0ACC2Z5W8_9PEZI|nr:RNase MRP subunit [Cladosporium sp. JES 115]